MKSFWLINVLLFQSSWLCGAFFTQYANLVNPILLISHFVLTPTRKQDAKLLLLVPLGLSIDFLQMQLGVFSATSVGSEPITSSFPLWLVFLWIMFVLSLNHSLRWLTRCSSPVLVVIGAVGGASSYLAGIKAGALQSLVSDSFLFVSLLLAWGVLLPTLVWLQKRYFSLGLTANGGKS